MKPITIMGLLAATLLVAESKADSFGTGANAFDLNFVNIGYAGNTADSTGYGSVDHDYRIGMHEVTIDQFAKARAADSRIGDGDENPYGGGVNRAASYTSWLEGAKFANWLTTGDAYSGAYQFNGSGVLTAVDRDAAVSAYGTVYVLPSEDEWYKAAYFKPDASGYTLYATGNSVPVVETDANYDGYGGAYSAPWDVGTGGIAENNGTFDMNGNVSEWNESAYDGTLSTMSENRVIRGGAFYNFEDSLRSSFRINSDPSSEISVVGFRVAAIPEPSSLMLMVLIGAGWWVARRK